MCAPNTLPKNLDALSTDAFGERMVGMINNGALALMTSVGHRTGLFDAMATHEPDTSAGVAAAAGLNERYVREWLGAMVTGGIVLYDAADGHYHLPAAHAACLTRAASPDNLAAVTQFLPLLAGVESEIVDCFHRGGGVPYAAFPRFQEVMAEESGQSVVSGLVETILPLVPGLIERLREGIDVLDVGCGAGRALNLLARTFPRSRFVGYDISPDGIATARREAAARGLKNLRFERQDVSAFSDTSAFDFVTAFDAIHDQAKPAETLANIRRALRADGAFLMQDIAGSSRVENNADHPLGPFLYTISCMHCMTVSLADDGAGLGAMWGRETAEQMLNEAGFAEVTVSELEHDPMNYFYVAR